MAEDQRGEFDRATALLEKMLAIDREFGNIADSLGILAGVPVAKEDFRSAALNTEAKRMAGEIANQDLLTQDIFSAAATSQ